MNRRRIKNPLLFCPICEVRYDKEVKYQFCNVKTNHHLFPSFWYGKIGIKVIACSQCHTYEFHKIFRMTKRVWSKYECINNWVKFCKMKGKNAYELYPELKQFENLN